MALKMPLTQEEAQALSLLTSFEGNGWLCPVTISLPVEAAQNQQEAIEACVAALTKLGVTVRPAWREEGR